MAHFYFLVENQLVPCAVALFSVEGVLLRKENLYDFPCLFFPSGTLVLICDLHHSAYAVPSLSLSTDFFSQYLGIPNTFLLNFICTFLFL